MTSHGEETAEDVIANPVKEQQLLDAAARVFRNPDYNVFSQVQYTQIAEESGWSERTVRAYFTREDLRRKLVSHMLTEEAARAQIDPVALGDALSDRSMSIIDPLVAIGEHFLNLNLTDPMIRSTMALWPYAKHHGSEGGSEHVAERIAAIYDVFDEQIIAGVSRFIVNNLDVLVIDGRMISVDDFAKLALALTEGLSLRYAIDPDSVDPTLPGRGYAALFAAMIRFDHDEVTDPEGDGVPELLKELDRRRGFRPPTSDEPGSGNEPT